ncbi:MAG: choice-of-anchor L domain-containing protein [Nannocystaceae bacterium]
MVVGCTGDDIDTAGSATDTDSSTSVTASTTATTTASSATDSDSGTSTTMGGSMSDSDSGSTTSDETTTTDGTTAGTTDGTTSMGTDTTDGTTTDGTTDGTTTMMATDSSTTEPGVCGDGNIDPGEQCDDGNNEDGDGCEANCTLPPDPTCPDEMSAVKCDNNTNNWYQAMELGCSDNPDESIVLMNESLTSNNANAWRIAKGFGSYMQMGELLYSPRGGDSFLMVSTGVIAQPNGQGIVTEGNNSQVGNGNNNNDDSDSLPPPINVNNGSNNGNGGTPFMNCDGVGDCSDSLEDAWNLGTGDPNDKLWFTFQTVVPPLVESYSFNFVYFSSEWPTYVNTQFNDLLIAWQTSEAYTGNVTFIGDQPLTVTSLNSYLGSDGYSGNEPQLQGTGFEQHAGSDWFGANQNVVAGETLTMTFMIADMGDSILATMAILDNFHWNCEECIPVDDPACTGEVPDPKCCGVIEPQ